MRTLSSTYNSTKIQNHNIDALRIFCTIIIVYYHIFSNIKNTENKAYQELYTLCRHASILVEFFLVIGGYYLWGTIQKGHETSIILQILDKFFRLWPVLAVTTLGTVVIHKLTLSEALFDIFMLRNTGISLSNSGIIWYVGPYFWCTVLILAMFRYFDKKQCLLLMAVLTYFGYTLNLNYHGGAIGREIIFDLLSLGVVRVFCGLSIGVLTAAWMDALHKTFPCPAYSPILSAIVFTLLEGLCLYIIISHTLFGISIGKNQFLMVIVYIVILICFTENKGYISRLLNRKVFTTFSKPCYSIYVMQQFVFYILRLTLWKNITFINTHPLRTLLLSTGIAILVGTATYFLVEKTAFRFWKHYKSKIVLLQNQKTD